MNILFVASDTSPFNPKQGAEQRSNLLLRACCEVGNVDVICFCCDEIEDSLGANVLYSKTLPNTNCSFESRIDKVLRLFTSLFVAGMTVLDREKEKIIDSFVGKRKYDYIVIRYAIPAVNCGLLKYADKLVVDVDDNVAEKILIEGKFAKSFRNRLFYKLYAANVKRAMLRFEKIIHKAFYSNKADCNTNKSILLPNIPYYNVNHNSSEEKRVLGRLLFVGDMEYNPNIEAVDHFIKNVFPLVKKECPEVSFQIVGRVRKVQQTAWTTNSDVEVLGFVQDIEQYYDSAHVFVLPMYSGAGTCIKFLEAIQMGCPVCTTECGFRGYDEFFTDNVDCFVAKNDTDFANNIAMLLKDNHKRTSIVSSASKHLQDYYKQNSFFEIVKSAFLL